MPHNARGTWTSCINLERLPIVLLAQKQLRSCRQRQTEALTRSLRPTGSSCGKRRTRVQKAAHRGSSPVRRQGYGQDQFSLPMVLPQHNCHPQTLCNLTYSQVNTLTVLLAPKEAMQFGQALQRLLYQINHAYPCWGHVFIAKNASQTASTTFFSTQMASSSLHHLADAARPRYSFPVLSCNSDGLGIIAAGVLHPHQDNCGPNDCRHCLQLEAVPPHIPHQASR